MRNERRSAIFIGGNGGTKNSLINMRLSTTISLTMCMDGEGEEGGGTGGRGRGQPYTKK